MTSANVRFTLESGHYSRLDVAPEARHTAKTGNERHAKNRREQSRHSRRVGFGQETGFDAESLASKPDHRSLRDRFGQSVPAANIQISGQRCAKTTIEKPLSHHALLMAHFVAVPAPN